MDMSNGWGNGKGKTSREELLRRLDELTVDAGLNEQDDGGELSEAERLARDAVPPKRRVDGELVGTPKQRPMTPSMMEFAKGLIEGKTQFDAYRMAYPNAQGNERTIKANAWKMSQDPRVRKMLQEHWGETVEALTEDAVAVKRYVIKNLLELSKDAKQEGSKLKALELMGKTVGMFKQSEEKDEKELTADVLKQELARHLRLVKNVRPISKQSIIDVTPEPVSITAQTER